MASRSYDIFQRSWHFSVALPIVLSVVGGSAHAQSTTDPDWPCVQHLVPEVSAAVIWPGPLPESLQQRWQDDAPITDLVTRMTSRRTSLQDASNLIEEFAQSSAPDQKQQQLTLLFAGVLETLNTRRRSYINTIKRFTRHQNAVAAQVRGLLNELAALEDNIAEDAGTRRQEVEETVRWHQRMFDQREQSMLALCEQPVGVEQTLGDLARAIAEFLD